MWIIYKHTNKINGKVYIGQTQAKAKLRWNNGLGYKNSSYFYSAIQKYGWENFEHEIIEENILTAKEAYEREQYWIKYYHSFVGDEQCNGYNLTIGGHGNFGRIVSEETKQKISKAKLGKKMTCKAWNLGIPLSEERKQNLRLKNLGKKQSEETKQKRKESLSKLKWFNDGKINIRSVTCPDGFKPGRINFELSEDGKKNSSHKGSHWYTNGIEDKFCIDCPEGFWLGRSKFNFWDINRKNKK